MGCFFSQSDGGDSVENANVERESARRDAPDHLVHTAQQHLEDTGNGLNCVAVAAVLEELEELTCEPRKRCKFGEKCYRKNPDHFKEFCHPGDTDWDQSAKNSAVLSREVLEKQPFALLRERLAAVLVAGLDASPSSISLAAALGDGDATELRLALPAVPEQQLMDEEGGAEASAPSRPTPLDGSEAEGEPADLVAFAQFISGESASASSPEIVAVRFWTLARKAGLLHSSSSHAEKLREAGLNAAVRHLHWAVARGGDSSKGPAISLAYGLVAAYQLAQGGMAEFEEAAQSYRSELGLPEYWDARALGELCCAQGEVPAAWFACEGFMRTLAADAPQVVPSKDLREPLVLIDGWCCAERRLPDGSAEADRVATCLNALLASAMARWQSSPEEDASDRASRFLSFQFEAATVEELSLSVEPVALFELAKEFQFHSSEPFAGAALAVAAAHLAWATQAGDEAALRYSFFMLFHFQAGDDSLPEGLSSAMDALRSLRSLPENWDVWACLTVYADGIDAIASLPHLESFMSTECPSDEPRDELLEADIVAPALRAIANRSQACAAECIAKGVSQIPSDEAEVASKFSAVTREVPCSKLRDTVPVLRWYDLADTLGLLDTESVGGALDSVASRHLARSAQASEDAGDDAEARELALSVVTYSLFMTQELGKATCPEFSSGCTVYMSLRELPAWWDVRGELAALTNEADSSSWSEAAKAGQTVSSQLATAARPEFSSELLEDAIGILGTMLRKRLGELPIDFSNEALCFKTMMMGEDVSAGPEFLSVVALRKQLAATPLVDSDILHAVNRHLDSALEQDNLDCLRYGLFAAWSSASRESLNDDAIRKVEEVEEAYRHHLGLPDDWPVWFRVPDFANANTSAAWSEAERLVGCIDSTEKANWQNVWQAGQAIQENASSILGHEGGKAAWFHVVRTKLLLAESGSVDLLGPWAQLSPEGSVDELRTALPITAWFDAMKRFAEEHGGGEDKLCGLSGDDMIELCDRSARMYLCNFVDVQHESSDMLGADMWSEVEASLSVELSEPDRRNLFLLHGLFASRCFGLESDDEATAALRQSFRTLHCLPDWADARGLVGCWCDAPDKRANVWCLIEIAFPFLNNGEGVPDIQGAKASLLEALGDNREAVVAILQPQVKACLLAKSKESCQGELAAKWVENVKECATGETLLNCMPLVRAVESVVDTEYADDSLFSGIITNLLCLDGWQDEPLETIVYRLIMAERIKVASGQEEAEHVGSQIPEYLESWRVAWMHPHLPTLAQTYTTDALSNFSSAVLGSQGAVDISEAVELLEGFWCLDPVAHLVAGGVVAITSDKEILSDLRAGDDWPAMEALAGRHCKIVEIKKIRGETRAKLKIAHGKTQSENRWTATLPGKFLCQPHLEPHASKAAANVVSAAFRDLPAHPSKTEIEEFKEGLGNLSRLRSMLRMTTLLDLAHELQDDDLMNALQEEREAVAEKFLKEACNAVGDPQCTLLRLSLFAASALNCQDLPSFQLAEDAYHSRRILPECWDVRAMVEAFEEPDQVKTWRAVEGAIRGCDTDDGPPGEPDFDLLASLLEGAPSEELSKQPWLAVKELLQKTSVSVPKYWTHCGYRGKFDRIVAIPRNDQRGNPEPIYPEVQNLLDATWMEITTRDRPCPKKHDKCAPKAGGCDCVRKGGTPGMPQGLAVRRILRNEDSEMWGRYDAKRAAIREKRSAGVETTITAKTAGILKNERAFEDLQEETNECYLFHGTKVRAALSIAQDNFSIDLAGTNVGTMYGKGGYFCECSSKADEYAKDEPGGYYEGIFALLLCRVTMGNPYVTEERDIEARQKTDSGEADSTLGDRAAKVGTYREFVIYDLDQVYPEYCILYERLGDGYEAGGDSWGAMRRSDSKILLEVPTYWKNAHRDPHDGFSDFCPVTGVMMNFMRKFLQRPELGVPGEDLAMLSQVLEVQRLELSSMWLPFLNQRKLLQEGGCTEYEGQLSVTSAALKKMATNEADVVIRPKCPFGEGCYRKNAQHKLELSHPGDPDWNLTEEEALTAGDQQLLDISAGMLENVDETINETFLWCALSSRSSFREIVDGGLHNLTRQIAGLSSCILLYDSPLAARKAAEAEAKEKPDCYVLLLCRALCGSAGMVDDLSEFESDEEGVTCFIESIEGQPRRFALEKASQVYPEYAAFVAAAPG